MAVLHCRYVPERLGSRNSVEEKEQGELYWEQKGMRWNGILTERFFCRPDHRLRHQLRRDCHDAMYVLPHLARLLGEMATTSQGVERKIGNHHHDFKSSRDLREDMLTKCACSRRVQERPAQPDGQEGSALSYERRMSRR